MKSIASILFVTYHFPPEVGGIQTRISKYLACLSREGIRTNVFVVMPVNRASGLGVQVPNAKVVRLDGGLTKLPRNLARLLSALAGQRVDVVHVFTGASTLFGTAALLAGRSFGLPAAMSLFGREDVVLPNRLGRVLLCVSISLATSISTNSEATAKLLPPKARRKVRILLGGADTATEPPTGRANLDDKSVLFVGRLVKRKGVDDLIAAMSQVVSEVPEARLTIVGDGPERESLEDQVNGLGLRNSVSFRGTLRGKELQDEYAKCTVFALASKDVPEDSATEGLGLTLIEAAMHQKPLVGTSHGGIPEVVKDGVSGFIVSPGEPKELATALSRLLLNPELAKRLGENAIQTAQSRFTWIAATRRLLDSYSSMSP